MNENTPRSLRWTIRVLSVLLFFLFLWLEGFVLGDIDDLEGPNQLALIEGAVFDSDKDEDWRLSALIEDKDLEVKNLEELKRNRLEARGAAQATLNQFQSQVQFERERGGEAPEDLTRALDNARQSFTQANSAFEEANQRVGQIQLELQGLRREQAAVATTISKARAVGQARYQDAWSAHRFKVAAVKLAFIVPLFLVAARLTVRKRNSLWSPILQALLLSSFWQLGVVMHDHFPREFFKYIAITAAVVIVIAFLMRSMRMARTPQRDVLMRRRREAYQAQRCPECAFPIPAETGEGMSCAACGASLFAACCHCGHIRHALLPHCRHCGDLAVPEKTDSAAACAG